MNDDAARCLCGHGQQIHTPTGRLDDTTVRGVGPCTAGGWGRRCQCHDYIGRRR